MPQIFRKDFSQGLCPSDDEFNGRQNGLLRMDNLYLDEQGAIELTRGYQQFASGFGSILFLYSKIIGATKYRYMLNNLLSSIQRIADRALLPTIIQAGCSPTHAAFGNAFGYVLACSGTKCIKDDGTNTYSLGIQVSLGIPVITNPFAGGAFFSGNYQYIQVDVSDHNPTYVAQSAASLSTISTAIVGSAVLTPNEVGIDPQVTKHYWFRFGGTLDTYYFVGSSAVGATFTDEIPDASALLTNIKLNQFLLPIAIGIPDEILSMAGPFAGRMLYMTARNIYISEQFNIDAYDTRNVIQLSSSTVGEKNLFLAQANASVTIAATTSNIYEISGTLSPNADGTLDIFIRPYNIAQPPINDTFAVYNSALFYVASDGIRVLSATQSQLLDDKLDLLFKGFNRYGMTSFLVVGGNQVGYRLCIYKNKLIFLAYESNRTNANLYVYDLIKKYWYRWNLFPGSLYTEEDGTLIAGFPDGELGILDTTYFLRFSNLQAFDLQTVFSNEAGLQRKDTYHLRLLIDTGGSSISVSLKGEQNSGFVFVGTVAVNGLTEVFIPLSLITLQKRYALQITGTGANFFRLVEWGIEYDVRPQPVLYHRILPDNLGTPSRKRMIHYAFVIDTLGHDVVFTPYVDAVPGGAVIVNTTSKQTYIYCFNQDTVGTDISATLDGGAGQTFEFYDLNLSECVAEKLPPPTSFLRIPPSDLGTGSRKRISTVALTIDTKGQNVVFQPFIDNSSSFPTQTFNTNGKTTVLYEFNNDTVGTTFWGTLNGAGLQFEYYGINLGESVTEKLPLRQIYLKVPATNFGIAAKKRIRTIPFVINTFGTPVLVTPVVDGLAGAGKTVTTAAKGTAFYYFDTDSFGVDYGIVLSGNVFEFYEIQKPEDVETLPVGKIFDQVGPVDFTKIGKILEMRVRLISTGSLMSYTIYSQDIIINSGSFTTVPNTDQTYTIKLPQGVIGNLARIEFKDQSLSVFYRWKVELRVNLGGMKTEQKTFTLK